MKKQLLRYAVLSYFTGLMLTGCAASPEDSQGVVWIAENTDNTALSPADKQAIETGCKEISADRFLACVAMVARHMPPIDPNKRMHFGERYNPKKWAACMKSGFESRGMYGTGGCESYRLRRLENPEYWPYPNVPAFKWPDGPKESVYRPGMSSTEYFDALCKAEAGEFIYKHAEYAEGIYQIRPRAMEDDNDRQQDRFVIEDPFGYQHSEVHDPFFFYLSTPNQLQYFETPPVKVRSDVYWASLGKSLHPSFANKPGDDITVFRYSGYDSRDLKSARRDFDTKLKSRYGYVWRGIDRPNDRQNDIGGGEIAVVDLSTNEIIALKRGFVMAGQGRTGRIRWETARLCPGDQQQFPKFIENFLKRVLKP